MKTIRDEGLIMFLRSVLGQGAAIERDTQETLGSAIDHHCQREKENTRLDWAAAERLKEFNDLFVVDPNEFPFTAAEAGQWHAPVTHKEHDSTRHKGSLDGRWMYNGEIDRWEQVAVTDSAKEMPLESAVERLRKELGSEKL